jgi:hypothetical protein
MLIRLGKRQNFRVEKELSLDEKIYLGLDPGSSGGLVAVHSNGRVRLLQMPETELEIWDWIQPYGCKEKGSVVAVLEKVGGYIGEAQNSPGSRMFNFGWSYGGLRMALVAAGFREDETFFVVTPQEWQKGIGLQTKRKQGITNQGLWKKTLKLEACKRFPTVQGITLKTADALLIAYYCKSFCEGGFHA